MDHLRATNAEALDTELAKEAATARRTSWLLWLLAVTGGLLTVGLGTVIARASDAVGIVRAEAPRAKATPSHAPMAFAGMSNPYDDRS